MKKANRGFTLIELLAVIIILAIVMVLAAPGVLNAMSTAREKAAQTEATKFATKAIEYIDQQKLLSSPVASGTFLQPSTVGVTVSSGYTGYIYVKDSINDSTVFLTNGSYCVVNVAAKSVSSTAVKKGNVCPTRYFINDSTHRLDWDCTNRGSKVTTGTNNYTCSG